MDNWRKLKGFGFKGFSRASSGQDKGHFNQFDSLVKSIKTGGESLIPFDEIINTTKGSFAAIESLMGTSRLKLYFHTLREVKPVQLYYQLYYKIIKRFFKPKVNTPFTSSHSINFDPGIINGDSLFAGNSFRFLNLEKCFKEIDWNYNDYGKLWTYNLNYFDYLHQGNMSREAGLELTNTFCDDKATHRDGYEPYPISLRGMNWVKFLSQHQIKEARINQQLFDDYQRLRSSLEYHLLANHLIENAFSLLFGAYYFQDEVLYRKAKSLLIEQLEEQILPDGAHYELSPMYHCIMLHRVLDSYNLVAQNAWKSKELANLLKSKALVMLSWLKAIQFKGGDLPMVNDSTRGIAPTPDELYAYAERLGITAPPSILKESGYRKLEISKLEILFDVGQIAPSYQPGHSHADSLQILVHSEGTPLIVDTGISTYEKNERRHIERSTSSHNTVTVNGLNSSQVWSGFRVGKRAHVTVLQDDVDGIAASHNGYRSLGITCSRSIKNVKDALEISDTVSGAKETTLVEGHLHFHPKVTFKIEDQRVLLNNTIIILFPKETTLQVKDYSYCNGFNDIVPAKKITYSIPEQITFTIAAL